MYASNRSLVCAKASTVSLVALVIGYVTLLQWSLSSQHQDQRWGGSKLVTSAHYDYNHVADGVNEVIYMGIFYEPEGLKIYVPQDSRPKACPKLCLKKRYPFAAIRESDRRCFCARKYGLSGIFDPESIKDYNSTSDDLQKTYKVFFLNSPSEFDGQWTKWYHSGDNSSSSRCRDTRSHISCNIKLYGKRHKSRAVKLLNYWTIGSHLRASFLKISWDSCSKKCFGKLSTKLFYYSPMDKGRCICSNEFLGLPFIRTQAKDNLFSKNTSSLFPNTLRESIYQVFVSTSFGRVVLAKQVGNKAHERSFDVVLSRKRNIQRILVHGYMRSGSTYLSFLLNETAAEAASNVLFTSKATSNLTVNRKPSTFFSFEPLRGLVGPRAYSGHENVALADRAALTSEPSLFHNISMTMLDALLSCQLHRLPSYSITFFYRKSIAVEEYRVCLNANVRSTLCLTAMRASCLDADFAIVKLIRAATKTIPALADLYHRRGEDLKVIHLVRDPRAILASRWKNKMAVAGETRVATDLCTAMESDMDMVEQWNSGHTQDPFIRVVYEELAALPVQYMKFLYKKLFGTDSLPSSVIEKLSRLTAPKSGTPERPFSVFRLNPNKTANAWKKLLPTPTTVHIQDFCNNTLSRIGYPAYTNT